MPTKHKPLEELRNETRQTIGNLRHKEWELVLEFFFVFSRFERALLRQGYYSCAQRGDLKADWKRFADVHNDPFSNLKAPKLAQAVQYYQQQPPKKQVVQNGQLEWSPSPPNSTATELDRLLILVRRVRNNLFHGEKLGNLVGGSDFGRDEQLLQHGLTILYACLTLDSDICNYFFS